MRASTAEMRAAAADTCAAATAVEATAATTAVGSTAAATTAVGSTAATATAVGTTATAAAFSRVGRGRERGRNYNDGKPEFECRHDVPRSARTLWSKYLRDLNICIFYDCG
jgi:hypothetical protein